MPRGSWFRTHKKQIVIHTMIVAAFLLFLLFLAEPLFDRVTQVQGESRLYETSIPAATNNIRYWIDHFQVTTQMIEIRGWAFIEGYDSLDSEIYIVLKSDGGAYVFDTRTAVRPKVTQAFEELNLNLDYSGFAALIPAGKIVNGKYSVGIYITKGDIKALQYTHKVVDL